MNIVGVVGAVVALSLLTVLTVTGVVLYYNPLMCLRGRDLSLTHLSLRACWSQSGLPVLSPPHLCLCMELPVTIWGRHRREAALAGLVQSSKTSGTPRGAVSNAVSFLSYSGAAYR